MKFKRFFQLQWELSHVHGMCLEIDFSSWGLGKKKFYFYDRLKEFAKVEIVNVKGFLDGEICSDGKIRFYGVDKQLELPYRVLSKDSTDW